MVDFLVKKKGKIRIRVLHRNEQSKYIMKVIPETSRAHLNFISTFILHFY